MDLDFIQEQLDTFSTFGGNIGDALQLIPQLLESFFSLFQDNADGESGLSQLSSNTSDIFGGDEAANGDDAGNGDDAAEGSSGSSSDEQADA